MNNFHILVLPLQPRPNKSTVLTVFRADNFDKNVDKKTGVGAINMMTIMAFQEISDYAVSAERKIDIPQTWSRNVNVEFGKHDVALYEKQEPITTCSEQLAVD